MLSDSHSNFVYIDIRPQFVQHLDENNTFIPCVESEEDSLPPQMRDLLLNLSVNLAASRGLMILLILIFLFGLLRYVFDDLCNVQLRVQLLDPIVEDVENLFHAPLLLVSITGN